MMSHLQTFAPTVFSSLRMKSFVILKCYSDEFEVFFPHVLDVILNLIPLLGCLTAGRAKCPEALLYYRAKTVLEGHYNH